MHFPLEYDWSPSRDEARRIQQSLSGQVSLDDDYADIRTVAGLHIAYPRSSMGVVAGRASVVLLTFPDLDLVEAHVVSRPVTFPHIADLLSFREAPIAIAALRRLRVQPDLLLTGGPGIAHPRRFGIASHLGVLLDLPAIGCASSMHAGGATEPRAAAEPGTQPGAAVPMRHGTDIVGAALRTRAGSRPLYVSPGHRVSVHTATSLAMRCTSGFRLPEPIRLAVRLASQGTHESLNH
jgi:deoxyribonuclease V